MLRINIGYKSYMDTKLWAIFANKIWAGLSLWITERCVQV